MRTCAQCGLSVAQTATFCPVCGATDESLGSPGPTQVDPGPALPDAQAGAAEAASGDVGLSEPSPEPSPEDAASRLEEAAQTLRDAALKEKTDPALAARLYRVAIVRYLDVADDPLGRGDVRRGLLRGFDRLSLVLKRQGLTAEALEEVESAASLGLLDCADRGIKGHREALKKRRVSLRRAAGPGPTVR